MPSSAAARAFRPRPLARSAMGACRPASINSR
jgi:hypothetical protein